MADIASRMEDFDPEHHFQVCHLRRLGILKPKPQAEALVEEPAHAPALSSPAVDTDQIQRCQSSQKECGMSFEQQEAAALEDLQMLPCARSLPQQQDVFQDKSSNQGQQASPGLNASPSAAASDQQLIAPQEEVFADEAVQRLSVVASMYASEKDRSDDAKLRLWQDLERHPTEFAAHANVREWAALEVAQTELSPGFIASRFTCLKKILAKVRFVLGTVAD